MYSYLLKCCVIFIFLIYGSMQDCVLTQDVLRCDDINQKELMYQYNSKVTEEDNITTVEVVGGDVQIVEMFHGPLAEKLEKIAMKSCGVEKVSGEAFAKLKNLKELDLSHNRIADVNFIQNLPDGIQIIRLSNNSIDHLDDVFENLPSLRIIDLSHCDLSTLDFTLFKDNLKLELVNVSNNRISSSVSKEYLKNIKCVDVSHNDLTTYDNVPSYCLDFSHTNSTGYHWYNVSERNKTVYVEKFLFSGNDKLKISATNLNGDALNIEIKHLNVSQFKSDASALNLTQVKVTSEFVLKDSPLNVLDKSVFDFKVLFYDEGTNATFDLSNCSIRDISEGYFQAYNLGKLNLCHNAFKEIKSGTFKDAYIVEVIICDSNVEVIDRQAFQDFHCKKLNLTRNKLSEITFNATGLKELDLSWNSLQFVNRSTFAGFPELQFLDLRHNLISKIDDNALSLENVQRIYLSNNKLTTLPVFSNMLALAVLYLDQNPVNVIEKGTFTTLPQLVSVNLAQMQLETIQPASFYQVGNLKEVDFSSNKITVIPNNVFVQAPNLHYLNLNGNSITTLGISDDVDLVILKICPSSDLRWSIPTLRTLYISQASLDYLHLSGLPNLTNLNLDDVEIAIVTPDTLSGLHQLRSLDEQQLFKHTTVIRTDTFKDLRLVTNLNLTGLSLETIEPGGFNGLVGLEKLTLGGNRLSEVRRCSFCGLSNVWYLDLSGNGISKVYPGAFAGLHKIVHLKLNNNELYELTPDVSGLSDLAILDLSGNRLKSICGSEVGSLSKLRVLDLSGNDVSYIGCARFMTNLEHLNLERNDLVQLDAAEALKVAPMLKYVNLNDNYGIASKSNVTELRQNNAIVIYW